MSIIKAILETYKSKGLSGLKHAIVDKMTPKRTVKNIDFYLSNFEGKKGIEIGGPSSIFSRELPIYNAIGALDGCNFSNQTVWEGNIVEGRNYNYYKDKKGHQYICEATNLDSVPDEDYDFLIASHCLEHCANPLKTVKEWLRVVKKGGVMLLVLPDRRWTFDHNRPVTTIEHLRTDFENDIDETDLTHLKEILELHDLTLDLAAGTIDQFKSRSLDNFKNRCLHHHVFDFKLLQDIYAYYNVKVIKTEAQEPYHQIILGVKQ
jgi:SAM-dependent methyltransferase